MLQRARNVRFATATEPAPRSTHRGIRVLRVSRMGDGISGDDAFPVTSSKEGTLAAKVVPLPQRRSVAHAADAFLARNMPSTTRRSYAQTMGKL